MEVYFQYARDKNTVGYFHIQMLVQLLYIIGCDENNKVNKAKGEISGALIPGSLQGHFWLNMYHQLSQVISIVHFFYWYGPTTTQMT